MATEKRVVCGKARSCRIENKKVTEVYDEELKVYIPYEEFVRQYGGKMGARYDPEEEDSAADVYFSTRGKKEKDKKVIDTKSKAVGAVTTSNVNVPITELPKDEIVALPDDTEVDIKEEPKKDKFLEKNYHNIVEETIDLLYMQED